mmetsp:Transcript_29142/g.46802  ORF Transcript_29142/g.46802 Transcript_29142/m.46802 type:complete len:93 (-) Transcript_29142:308-586(-)
MDLLFVPKFCACIIVLYSDHFLSPDCRRLDMWEMSECSPKRKSSSRGDPSVGGCACAKSINLTSTRGGGSGSDNGFRDRVVELSLSVLLFVF